MAKFERTGSVFHDDKSRTDRSMTVTTSKNNECIRELYDQKPSTSTSKGLVIIEYLESQFKKYNGVKVGPLSLQNTPTAIICSQL